MSKLGELHPASLAALGEVRRVLAELGTMDPSEPALSAVIDMFLQLWAHAKPGRADLEAKRFEDEAKGEDTAELAGKCLVLVTAYAAMANAASHSNDYLEAWRLASAANNWCGTARGLILAGVKINCAQLDAMRDFAASGGVGKKLKDSDGKQAAKRNVEACFWAWTAAKKDKDLSAWKDPQGREILSAAAFANEMLRRFLILKSTATITDKWIPIWLAEGPTARGG